MYYGMACKFIENATETSGFYDGIREILREADKMGKYPEDWEIKDLQRKADCKYKKIENTDIESEKKIQKETKERLGDNFVETVSACRSRYKGYTAFVSKDNNVYLGKLGKYLYCSKYGYLAGYDNSDNDLIFVSKNKHLYDFLRGVNSALTQTECISEGFLTDEDYKEMFRVETEVLNGLEMKEPYKFCGYAFTYPNYQ